MKSIASLLCLCIAWGSCTPKLPTFQQPCTVYKIDTIHGLYRVHFKAVGTVKPLKVIPKYGDTVLFLRQRIARKS